MERKEVAYLPPCMYGFIIFLYDHPRFGEVLIGTLGFLLFGGAVWGIARTIL